MKMHNENVLHHNKCAEVRYQLMNWVKNPVKPPTVNKNANDH